MCMLSYKLRDKTVPDSEIIQYIEHAKQRDPEYDINWRSDCRWSLLMYAAKYDRKELVRYLLANPNSIKQNSLFHFACSHIDVLPFLKLLLSHRNLDVNIQNCNGWTGLHLACYWGSEECIKELLLDARVDTLIRTNIREDTAQDIAIREDRHNIVKMLKGAGYTSLLRIPNKALCRDIVRMIIEEYIPFTYTL